MHGGQAGTVLLAPASFQELGSIADGTALYKAAAILRSWHWARPGRDLEKIDLPAQECCLCLCNMPPALSLPLRLWLVLAPLSAFSFNGSFASLLLAASILHCSPLQRSKINIFLATMLPEVLVSASG